MTRSMRKLQAERRRCRTVRERREIDRRLTKLLRRRKAK